MRADDAPDSAYALLTEPAALLAAESGRIVIDTRPQAQYAAGHIPGAIHASSYGLFVPGTRSDELSRFRTQVASAYGTAGITRERPIVVYETFNGMRAARELWILQYLGHRRVSILDGGLQAWQGCGGKLSSEPTTLPPAEFICGHVPEIVIGCDEIGADRDRPGRVVIDVRDEDEFYGLDETACCARRGHVPGAVWLEWTELLDAATGRFRSSAEVRAALDARAIDPHAELVPYCHRGARSAHAYYALRLAGMPRVRNYIGSWHEWSARTDLPLET